MPRDAIRPCSGCLERMAHERARTNRWCVGYRVGCPAAPNWVLPAQAVEGAACAGCRDEAERQLTVDATACVTSNPSLLSDLCGHRFADNLADLRERRRQYRHDLAWAVLQACVAAGHTRPGQQALFELPEAS